MTIYTRMVEILQQKLSTAGIPQDKAIECSTIAVDQIRREVGGTNSYMPKTSPWQGRIARNLTIKKKFNGRNLDEICREYKVSRATVYRICKNK